MISFNISNSKHRVEHGGQVEQFKISGYQLFVAMSSAAPGYARNSTCIAETRNNNKAILMLTVCTP